jgi:hypothetical protein
MALFCKYCGTECHNSAGALYGKVGGSNCRTSPTKKHVLAPTPPYCVYCGTECHNTGGALYGKVGGSNCRPSPTKKHQLSD